MTEKQQRKEVILYEIPYTVGDLADELGFMPTQDEIDLLVRGVEDSIEEVFMDLIRTIQYEREDSDGE